jgi:ADP-heptose:LPS heptosyltransferase
MKSEWIGCKKILCIRPDNMGDLLMSSPALRALKETFGASIVLLTSNMAAGIATFLPVIDEVIEFNAPWVKTESSVALEEFSALIKKIKSYQFDAAVIFTVFSQNPLPSAMIPFLAGIPRRLAYCRENPYALLTHWVPDKEPYSFVQHQVQRDLALVESIGARTEDKKLRLKLRKNVWPDIRKKLEAAGVDERRPWIIAHAGVSESKREYSRLLWIKTVRLIYQQFGYQVLLTGNRSEKQIVEAISIGAGEGCFNVAGLLDLEEFITLVKRSPLVITVNTATAHIAAATETPVIVLYALSNPQHSPWMARGKVLIYDIPAESRSRNEVLNYVHEFIHPHDVPMVMPEDILHSVHDILFCDGDSFIPEMIPLQRTGEQILQS